MTYKRSKVLKFIDKFSKYENESIESMVEDYTKEAMEEITSKKNKQDSENKSPSINIRKLEYSPKIIKNKKLTKDL